MESDLVGAAGDMLEESSGVEVGWGCELLLDEISDFLGLVYLLKEGSQEFLFALVHQ